MKEIYMESNKKICYAFIGLVLTSGLTFAAEYTSSKKTVFPSIIPEIKQPVKEQTASNPHGKGAVQVTHTAVGWRIQGAIHTVILNENDFSISALDGSITWNFLPSDTNDILLNYKGNNFPFRFTDAGKKDIAVYQTGYKNGLKITLSQFRCNNKNVDLELQLFVCMEGSDEDLVCDIAAGEKNAGIKCCQWPKGLRPEQSDFTVMPYMQGMLLPCNWSHKVWLFDDVSYGRGLYMPWWGHLQGKSALFVLMETPDDGGCNFTHPAGGPTAVSVKWLHSLGKLAYPRRLRYSFLREGNYVSLAKRYRRYVIEKGHFVPLTEKVARNPSVGRLIGSPVIHTSILYHVQPASSYYNAKDTTQNHQMVSFATRVKQLQLLAEKGVSQAYIHLDGWGYRGYDNLHPDILPPCPEAGGWEGLKQLADVCDKLGYIFALHDQYRDYYHDAASYDPRHTILDEKGERPFGNTWNGGDQSILCPRLAPGYVAHNYKEILAHDIKIRGAYLDVFSVVPPDECYNPEHPVTRSECLHYRAECFQLIRSFGGVVSSEEPADWAIPYLDLVHHGPFALENMATGLAMGIPIPLFNLVYHDALILPWSCNKKDWGIPQNDWGFLYGLINGGIPYLPIEPDDSQLKYARTICALNKRVGLLEMTKHEFLDDKYRKQRTTFSDGTTVTIDPDADSYIINKPLE
jgi:hypothetical protein